METISTEALTKARAYIEQSNIKADIYIKTANGLTLFEGLGDAECYLVIEGDWVQVLFPL